MEVTGVITNPLRWQDIEPVMHNIMAALKRYRAWQ